MQLFSCLEELCYGRSGNSNNIEVVCAEGIILYEEILKQKMPRIRKVTLAYYSVTEKERNLSNIVFLWTVMFQISFLNRAAYPHFRTTLSTTCRQHREKCFWLSAHKPVKAIIQTTCSTYFSFHCRQKIPLNMFPKKEDMVKF